MSGGFARLRAVTMLVGLLRAGITAGIAAVAVSIGLQVYLERVWQPEDRGERLAPPPAALTEIRVAQHRERLHAALDVYRLQYGQYPPELSALVEVGLVGTRALRYPSFLDAWFYRPIGDGYELFPPYR
jgi:hypothetical protein